MKAAVYIRVSTASQKTDSQQADIKRWLKGNGIDDAQWFEDTGSGRDFDRPALNELNAAVFNGEVDTIIVWKIDRIGRTMKEANNQLWEWTDRGIRFVSVTQSLDISDKIGKVLAGVLIGIADIELDHIRERQAAGIADAKGRGIYTGRKTGTLKANPARAKELRDNGMKPKEIMAALGIKSRSTLSKYLREV